MRVNNFSRFDMVQKLIFSLKIFILWLVLPLLAIVAMIVWFVLNSPAAFWFDNFQDKKAPVQVVMVSGSLINGSGLIAVVSENEKIPGIILPGRLSWNIDASEMIFARLTGVVSHTRAISNPVEISISATEFISSAINIRIPIGILQALGVPFSSLKITGYANILINPLKITAPNLFVKSPVIKIENFALKAFIYIQDRHTNDMPVDIGKYLINSKKLTENSLVLSVKSLTGPLLVDGDFKVNSASASYAMVVNNDSASGEKDDNLIKWINGKYAGVIKLPFILKSN